MVGVAALFVEATVQLGRRGIATVRVGLEPAEWLALAVLGVAFLYGEGVRALEQRWVPGMITRARELAPDAPGHHRALAPLYAMGLVGGERRARTRAWLGIALVVLAVLIVRALPEPWRGIVDLAVALALAWGLVAIGRQALASPANAGAAEPSATVE